jgi:hypothetical protein
MALRNRRYPALAVGAANRANRELAAMTVGINAARTFRCFALAFRVEGRRRDAFLDGWREEVDQADDEAIDLFPVPEQLELFS